MNKLYVVLGCAAALAGCNSSGPSQSTSDGGTDSGTGMYARRMDLVVGALPQSLAVVDVNNDKRPDILVARSTANGALTLVSASTAGVISAALLSNSLGDTPNSLGVGDFDADGTIDVAVSNFYGGNGSALFGPDFSPATKATFGDGAHPVALVVGDVNSDGKLDVLTANQVGNSVGVTLNLGNRMFGPRVDYATGATPGAMLLAATDITRPSRLDVIVTLPGLNKVRILLGQGGGTYSATQFTDLAVGQAPGGLAMADLNDDQSPDLVVTNRIDNTISVLLSQPGGTFAPAVTYGVGTQPMQLALGDIDGDGHLDAVVTNNGSATVSILRGQGGGSLRLTDTVTVGLQPLPVVITDLDGDGVKDIVVGNNGANTVTILFGKKI